MIRFEVLIYSLREKVQIGPNPEKHGPEKTLYLYTYVIMIMTASSCSGTF